MTLEEYAYLAEVISAFAIVVTLVYLAVQLKQNTTGIQTSAYQQWAAIHCSTFATALDKDIAEILVKGCIDSRDLSDDTYMRFLIWVREYMYMQQAQYLLYKRGVIDEELWNSNLKDLVGVYKYPGVKQLWDAGFKTGLTEDFVNVVEASSEHAIMMLWDKEKGFHASPFHE